MKIRIRGQSLRLRLTKSEVETMGRGGAVTELLHLSTQPQASIGVTLQGVSGAVYTLSVTGGHLVIGIPEALLKQWASSEEVGLSTSLETGPDCVIELLVEKDFQCLHRRPGEDERDNFPNPAEGERDE